MVMLLALNDGKNPKDLNIEWTLSYMEWTIPEGLKESFDDATDYLKHRQNYKEQASITIVTPGFNSKGVSAKASINSGRVQLSLIPSEAGIKLRGLFQRNSDKSQTRIAKLIMPSKIKYEKEMVLGEGGAMNVFPNKRGRIFGGQAYAWILIVKKMKGEIEK